MGQRAIQNKMKMLPCSFICCLDWGYLNLQAQRLLCMLRQYNIKLRVQRKKSSICEFPPAFFPFGRRWFLASTKLQISGKCQLLTEKAFNRYG